MIDKLLERHKKVFIGERYSGDKWKNYIHKRYNTIFANSTKNTLSHEESCFKGAGKVDSVRCSRTNNTSALPLGYLP